MTRRARDGSRSRSSASSLEDRRGQKIGVVALDARSPPARTASCAGALEQACSKRGAKGYVLDLRAQRRRAVSEAQLVASAFLRGGPIVTTRGRAVPSRTLRRDRRPDRADGPARRCSSTATRRRRRRSSPARCRTATGRRSSARARSARASSRRSSSSSNGGALDITAGQYFTPTGRNLGGEGVEHGQRHHARRARPRDDPKTRARRGAAGGAARVVRAKLRERTSRAQTAEPRARRRARAARALPRRRAVLRARAAASRSSATRARRGRAARAVLRPAARGRTRRSLRVLGRPDVARDVIEALMLDRGLRRSFPAGVERAAERGASRRSPTPPSAGPRATCASCRRSRSTRSTARDFDDAISRERAGDGRWRVWVHIADVSAFVRPGSATRPRGLPARDERLRARARSSRCCPSALSNDACSLVPGRGPARGHRRDRAAMAGARSTGGCLPPLADPLRRAARLRPGRPDLRRRRARAGAVGRAAGRGARGGGRASARRARGGALVLESAEPEFRFDRAGHVDRAAGAAADRVAPADRAPDDRRQRAGREAALASARSRRSIASTSGPSRRGRAPGRAAGVARRADAAARRSTLSPHAGGRRRSARLSRWSTSTSAASATAGGR